MRKVHLLLVNPRSPSTYWGQEYSLPLAGLSSVQTPLGLITVAALSPDSWEVSLCDENVEPVDLDAPGEVVGIGAMINQAGRAFELADAFRARGRTVVLGGPLAFSDPERCGRYADVVAVGEAERTWPVFCRDFERGAFAPKYVEPSHVDLALSPVPRFDLLKRDAYANMSIQTTRGCPHDCEFCDIVVMMGRRVRTKSVEQVVAEVEAVRHHNPVDGIFFTDDNFNGNVKYTRALLRALIDHRARTKYRPVLIAQASVNLAEQDEMLDLMVRAGLTRVFLGVESPRQQSLREVGKRQNMHGDLKERIEKIQRAGLLTWAGMIVGFDHDDVDIFAEQAEFLDQAGIAMAMVGMLNALPKTPLYERLEREGRLIPQDEFGGDNCAQTNIVPKRMTRVELLRGYSDLMSHLYKQENYTRRLRTNLYRMGPPVRGSSATRLPTPNELRSLWRAVKAFTFSRRPDYRRHFVPNLVRIGVRRPGRIVEACVHLGMWLHFDQYLPEMLAEIEGQARLEEARAQPLLSAVAAGQ